MITYKLAPNNKKYTSQVFEDALKRDNLSNPSFKGVSIAKDILSAKLQYKKLCSKDEFDKIINLLEPTYKEYFEQIAGDFRQEISQNPKLFKNLPAEMKQEIQDGAIIARPQKAFLGKFIDAVSGPISYVSGAFKNRFADETKRLEHNKLKEIDINLANIEGLIEYVKNSKEDDSAMLKQHLQEKIKKNFTKIKASYSSNLSVTLTDLATFGVAAGFHGCDFYNVSRRIDDNHKAAVKEAKVKVKQDAIRLVVLSYLTYVLTTLLKKDCNKSMPRMLAIASVIQVVAEILTRKVTGRPVLPVKEKELKRYQKKQKINASSKTQVADAPKFEKEKAGQSIPFWKQANAVQLKNVLNKVTFTGNPLVKRVFIPKKELIRIVKLTDKIDSSLVKRYTALIENKSFNEFGGKKLSDVFEDDSVNNIFLGEKESNLGRFLRCIFVPVTAPAKFLKKIMKKEQAQVDEMLEVRNYTAFVKRLLETKYKGKDVINDADSLAAFKKDVMNAAFASFRSTEANYNTANYSIIKKVFSYSIFTTFMSWDVYNITMVHSDGDKKKALVQAKQRFVQEIIRFFISVYTTSANLTMFGHLYNKTIANAFGLTTMTSTLNNILTRKAVGLPITPKSKKELEEMDKKNNKSAFYRYLNKFMGKPNEKTQAETSK